MKNVLGFTALILAVSCLGASGETKHAVTTPESGVVCDNYICADSNGISEELTKKHLGDAAADALKSQGDFDMTEFTLANGVFCDTKEKLCHVDRYFDADGKRSAVDPQLTADLFGK